LQPGHQDDCRRLGRQVEIRSPSPITAASSRLTTPTSAWPGDNEPATFGAEGPILDPRNEVAHDGKRDVGLEQGHAHLAQHVLDVVLGHAGLPAHRLDEAAQPIGEVRSHPVGCGAVSPTGRESTLWR
jgi:hypothetical protein